MQALIWAGVVVTVLGLIGLIWCVVLAFRAKRAGGSEDQVRAKLQRVVLINLAAMGLSGMGLMLVVLGVILG